MFTHCLVHIEHICCCSMGLKIFSKIKKKIILLSAAAVAAALLAIMLHCICARSACESWIWALSPAQANWTPLGPPGYSNWNRPTISSARLAVSVSVSLNVSVSVSVSVARGIVECFIASGVCLVAHISQLVTFNVSVSIFVSMSLYLCVRMRAPCRPAVYMCWVVWVERFVEPVFHICCR